MAESSDDERFENEAVKHDDTTLTNSYMEIVDKVNDIMNVNQAIDENKTESKKFVTTDFISPVFGRREAKLDYPTVPNFKEMINSKKTSEYNLEATMNMEPINEQIKKDDAFLNALKEFRKHLAVYSKNLPNASNFRVMVNKIDEKEELEKALEDYFGII